MGRVERLIRLFWDKKTLRPLNGNGLLRILKDRELIKWLLLAGVNSINYKNGKFYDQYGRELVFYECGFYISFYIKGRGER